MASIDLLFPTPRNTGHLAVPRTFFALGTYEGTITQVRGRSRPADAETWSDPVYGTVKDNGHWFVLFSLTPAAGTQYQVEVTGFDGTDWLDPITVEFDARAAQLLNELAPVIVYPPNDDPYVITGAEKTDFVAQGTTDTPLVSAGIQNLNTGVTTSATDFDTMNKIWYAYFPPLSTMPNASLQVKNQTLPNSESVKVQ